MLHAPTSEKQTRTSPSPANTPRQTPTFSVISNQPEMSSLQMRRREQWTSLQKTYGNQAILRALRAEKLQPKLTVGQPNDLYEQEADLIADQVMQTPTSTESDRDKSAAHSGHPPSNINIASLQATSHSTFLVNPQLRSDIQSAKSRGQPLADATRSIFEPRFGRGFSNVRVHPDFPGARNLGAQAFTTGQDIFFDRGQYQPETVTGQQLLAHELTHVVQQSDGTPDKTIQRQSYDDYEWDSEETQTPNLEEAEEDWWYDVGTSHEAEESNLNIRNNDEWDSEGPQTPSLEEGEGDWWYDVGTSHKAKDATKQRGSTKKVSGPISPHPEVATAAERLGNNKDIMGSYQRVEDHKTYWFFSFNGGPGGLRNNVPKPQTLQTWEDWSEMHKFQRLTIANLAGIHAPPKAPQDTSRKQNLLNRLRNAHKKWPSSNFVVVWEGVKKPWNAFACNIFVGEALFLAGKPEMYAYKPAVDGAEGSKKYYGAKAIYKEEGGFKKIKRAKIRRLISRGDIFSTKGHTGIVTVTDMPHRRFKVRDTTHSGKESPWKNIRHGGARHFFRVR
jgi:hypothetical protein